MRDFYGHFGWLLFPMPPDTWWELNASQWSDILAH